MHRLSGPGELLQAVPYLLGFHPAQSLVLVGLDEGAVTVTARLDLPDAGTPGVLEHTLAALRHGGSTSILGAVYCDAADAADYWPELPEALDRAAGEAGCDVLDVLLVGDGRWWSLRCRSEECCPPEGRPLPTAPSAFAAAATYSGVVALPDRAALAAVLDPLPADERERLDSAIAEQEHAAVRAALAGDGGRHERSVKRALFAAARDSDEANWPGLPEVDAARFGAALAALPVRDAVWVAVDDGRLDGRPLWRDLARRLPGPYDAPPLLLFGWAAWRAGDGTSAGIAADRAIGSDPDYTAAYLLRAAVANALDPRQFPKLRARSA